MFVVWYVKALGIEAGTRFFASRGFIARVFGVFDRLFGLLRVYFRALIGVELVFIRSGVFLCGRCEFLFFF